MLKEGFLLLQLAGLLAASQVPAGTKLELRLTSAVNSATSKAKDAIQAVVIAPVLAGNSIVIGPGTHVVGHVQEAKQAEAADQQAVLVLSFDQLRDSKGTVASITAKLVDVDNARE